MKSRYHIIWLFTLGLLISCSKSNERPPEEEEQIFPPEAVNLVFPENNSECQEGTVINESQSSLTFSWNASEHTDSYEIHIRNLDNGSLEVYESVNTEMVITLDRGVPYNWYVVSKSESTLEIAESEHWKFYNAGPGVEAYAPFPADLLSPVNNETVASGTTNILLQWEGADVDNDIAYFEVFFGTENPPTSSIGTTANKELNVDISSDLIYYWFVKTTDASTNTSISDIFKFRTE
ncbi:fibronectin type III domain-containing protein [Maribacter aurantiacus]|uniref:Fibronectin type III domain-containing protein n=1 Tax=Maribacter aurantiacus TaxID=1882343 RepID=A0A5R8M538_9FLAO|nr:fibronectin type III domain-containing protein [Maribacter aurantiacus]TLF44663.1 fibronectin type III domain-containing protein [Maribacter aurantiacus]